MMGRFHQLAIFATPVAALITVVVRNYLKLVVLHCCGAILGGMTRRLNRDSTRTKSATSQLGPRAAALDGWWR